MGKQQFTAIITGFSFKPRLEVQTRLALVPTKFEVVWRSIMRKRWRAAIFITALCMLSALSLAYSSKALAKLVLSPAQTDNFSDQVILHLPPGTDQEINLAAAERVVARRLDELDLSGSYRLVSQAGQLAVTLPNSQQTPYILNLITHVGRIEFIDGGQNPPLGRPAQTGAPANPAQGVYAVLFTGQEVEEVVPPDSSPGQIFYRLRLNPTAAQRLAQFVEMGSSRYICMVMDGQVINCSSMYHVDGNTLDILPNLASGAPVSLAELAIFLESGPLPVSLAVDR